MRTYASIAELIAANPDKALAVGNRIVHGGEGTHWTPDGHYYWSLWIGGRIVPQNWQVEGNMDLVLRNLTSEQLRDIQEQVRDGGPIDPPQPPQPPDPPNPPQPPDPHPVSMVDLGDLKMDGQVNAISLNGAMPGYLRLAVPNSIPTGAVGSARFYTQAGAGDHIRRAWFTRDVPSNAGRAKWRGIAFNVVWSWGVDQAGYQRVNPGEVWYIVLEQDPPGGAFLYTSNPW